MEVKRSSEKSVDFSRTALSLIAEVKYLFTVLVTVVMASNLQNYEYVTVEVAHSDSICCMKI
jgi:hypothetical protein